MTLEELSKGKLQRLQFSVKSFCTKCSGRGGKEGAVKTCGTCQGRGIKTILRQMGPLVQQMQQTCPDCEGEGEIIAQLIDAAPVMVVRFLLKKSS